MKTKTSHSLNSSKGFSGTFFIYALVKNVGKTIRTLQNPSLSPKNKDLETEELKSNPSNPSGCEKKTTKAKGYGCSGCGNKTYTQQDIWTTSRLADGAWECEHNLVNGWKCNQCGSEYQYIGGSRGPVLIQ